LELAVLGDSLVVCFQLLHEQLHVPLAEHGARSPHLPRHRSSREDDLRHPRALFLLGAPVECPKSFLLRDRERETEVKSKRAEAYPINRPSNSGNLAAN
jgi:hypothetical protein